MAYGYYTDEEFMRLAIDLAKRGGGYTNPNPRVGAVIVKDGGIIGYGWHERFGELHAERNALAGVLEDPRGATLYVTLEPCCHYGKTPPCTEAILEAGIAKVVIGSSDPNPLVAGKGAAILRNAGVEVIEGFMQAECDRLNPAFFRHITTGLPFVTLKYAMTLDGKIATVTGASKWITGPEARKRVHESRADSMAILCGIGTVLADDPALTCRDAEGLDPVRVVCDTDLRTPLDAEVVRTAGPAPEDARRLSDRVSCDGDSRYPRTILATAVTDETRLAPYREKGCDVLTVPKDADGHADLGEILRALGRDYGIDSVYIEGGSGIAWSALSGGLADRVQAFVAPKIFGGADAKTPVQGRGVDVPDDAFCLENLTVTPVGSDWLFEGDCARSGCPDDAESGCPEVPAAGSCDKGGPD